MPRAAPAGPCRRLRSRHRDGYMCGLVQSWFAQTTRRRPATRAARLRSHSVCAVVLAPGCVAAAAARHDWGIFSRALLGLLATALIVDAQLCDSRNADCGDVRLARCTWRCSPH